LHTGSLRRMHISFFFYFRFFGLLLFRILFTSIYNVFFLLTPFPGPRWALGARSVVSLYFPRGELCLVLGVGGGGGGGLAQYHPFSPLCPFSGNFLCHLCSMFSYVFGFFTCEIFRAHFESPPSLSISPPRVSVFTPSSCAPRSIPFNVCWDKWRLCSFPFFFCCPYRFSLRPPAGREA